MVLVVVIRERDERERETDKDGGRVEVVVEQAGKVEQPASQPSSPGPRHSRQGYSRLTH